MAMHQFDKKFFDFDSKEVLIQYLRNRSKHSHYQELHPVVRDILGQNCVSPSGKNEVLRWDYMTTHTNFNEKVVADIGANTGYFSIASIEYGSRSVVAYEGNYEHALFLKKITGLINLRARINVINEYFDFNSRNKDEIDIVLCLNVLHHLGSDFNKSCQTKKQALVLMCESLQHLSLHAKTCWFQMGFNWMGDRNFPFFENGFKIEMIDFVKCCCNGFWTIENIAIYNPFSQCYEPASDALLHRFDGIGEFLNRPLFQLVRCC